VELNTPAARPRPRGGGHRTHVITHLEPTIEQQDLELMERAATIATLEQQLQVLQHTIIHLEHAIE
jgi:hypothetical protein